MDFLKILKSFEEFVYEALLWLILLPQTLFRIVVHPARMCAYAAAELKNDDDRRFSDAMSPPLLLILCVLIAHVVDLAIRAQTPDTSGTLAGELLGSEQNLLVYRTIAFGLWSLAGAAYSLLRTGARINRESLRAPFYEQCYLVAPFALVVSVCASLTLTGPDGARLAAFPTVVAALWFWLVQIGWIVRKARLPLWRGVLAASLIVLIGAVANAAAGYALSHAGGGTASGPADAHEGAGANKGA